MPTNDFAAGAVLLGGELEADKVGCQKLGRGGSGNGELSVADPEPDVFDAKGVRILRRVCVFARAEEEEECEPHHVGGCEGFGIASG